MKGLFKKKLSGRPLSPLPKARAERSDARDLALSPFGGKGEKSGGQKLPPANAPATVLGAELPNPHRNSKN